MNDQSVDALWRQVQLYMGAGNTAGARDALVSLLQRQPRHAAAHMTLSHIAWADGRVRDAARHALDAASDLPPEPMSIVAVGMALLRAGETVAARTCLEHPLLTRVQSGSVVMCAAGLRRELGEDTEALTLLERAHALGVDGAEFRFARGLEFLFCGHPRDAEADLEASLSMDPAACAAALELARLRKQTPERNHLDDFDRRRRLVVRGTQDHAALEFARYKELEDIRRYEEAWEALVTANAIMQALYPCNPASMRQQVDGLVEQCARHFFGADCGTPDGPQPIFILGLPRSGTTLLDRLLGSHSQVISVGELEDFSRQLCWEANQRTMLDTRMLQRLPGLDYRQIGRRYLMQTQWRAPGARFFIDKQPWNHMLAGLIHRALPQARLLHLVRDPMDVCFSNFRALLGARYAYSFNLDTLGDHFLEYRRLMAHWHTVMPERILQVRYHDLVADTEATMRKVIAFCGLDWEPACVDPSHNPTAIGTLSAMQARGSIHPRAFGEWRRYERQLAGLQQLLHRERT
ncbi:MAG: tetratricopeptide repeat-containing sulfotransferase family protein [Rhodanobacteraceae bacterium]